MLAENFASVERGAAMPIEASIAIVGDEASAQAVATGSRRARGFIGGTFLSADDFF
jgi:hypothetical protein